MNAAKQAVWLFMVLLALSGLGWYCASSDPVQRLDKETLAKTVDLTVYHLVAKQFDAQGQLLHRLETPQLQHIPYDNTHELVTPYVMFSQSEQPPWELRAQTAKAINGGQMITFSDDVVIHQIDPHTNTESTITTEELTYYPKKKLAVTDKEICLKRPGSVVQSDGMRAYLADSRVELMRNARGQYKDSHS